MRLFSLSACLLALLSLAACGSGSSDNSLSTGTTGTSTNPVLIPTTFPTPTVTPQDGTGTGMTARELAFASYVFEQVNAYRTNNALNALTWDNQVAIVATNHTNDQKTNGILSHDGPAPCALPQDCLGVRLQTGGVTFITGGENLARGFADPDQMIQAWIASPAHKDILDDPNWTTMGIGYLEGVSPANASMSGPWVTLNCVQP